MAINNIAWKGGFKQLRGDESNPTFGVGVHDASLALHIFDPADAATDWAQSAFSDPTLLIHCSSTNAATDYIKIWHDDTDANIQAYGATQITIGIAGTEYLGISSSAFYPITTDGMTLGTSALNFADLYLDSGAVINFNNGDVTLTHSSNDLALAGGNLSLADSVQINFGTSDDVTIDWNGSVLEVLPATDDTGYIGIGNGTKDMDLTWFGGTNAKYVNFNVGDAYLYLEDVDLKLGDDDVLMFGDASGGDVRLKWDGNLLQMLPATDDTGYLAIGDGTTSMDFWVYGSTSAKYLQVDVGNDYLSLVNLSLYAPNLATSAGQAGLIYVNTNGYLIQSD